jgi:hypothetical protein
VEQSDLGAVLDAIKVELNSVRATSSTAAG